ncbi:MAG TPA: 4Fe-4S dicluster domain-containing protein [Caldisericia bacterium]|nr:4Fe-4S dicluster domain-containing protein [Caldisericia bacterium]HPF48806.1 4Fe-4S dicluster domain-containing protein [Caldisericia bacterium]HPI84270.1 4Fe-4S dicluster domain-containing protein [Caldisericia bacterium]HPQ93448.1 4Fe-4S dicluster domain-containing protein [Caldisericia bacterium]HRV74906.1 4Fe-4S dicluster domain-containing protein [Caldisericia bacterium]
MEHYVFEKEKVKKLLELLIDQFDSVYAPVSKGKKFTFDRITDPSQAKFNYVRTILPPKKYLMPQKEQIVSFDLGKDVPEFKETVEAPKQVIVGVHPCDLRAVSLLDKVMLSGNTDPYYKARRENTVIIGIDGVPDEYSYETSVMDLRVTEGFDLFLTDLGDTVLVDVATPKGKEIIVKIDAKAANSEQLSKREKAIESIKQMYTAKIDTPAALIPLSLEGKWDHKVWDEMGARCLSCGQCILVCPTCYCFNVTDDLDLTMKAGVRTRQWDGCQLADFAMVGHGENFRDDAGARIRHRFHRKFKYHIDSHSQTFCTGCGRCWEYCPSDINLVDIANTITSEE